MQMTRKIEMRAKMNNMGYKISLIINGIEFWARGDAVLGADEFARLLHTQLGKTYGPLQDNPEKYEDIIAYSNAAYDLAATFDLLIKSKKRGCS